MRLSRILTPEIKTASSPPQFDVAKDFTAGAR